MDNNCIKLLSINLGLEGLCYTTIRVQKNISSKVLLMLSYLFDMIF